MHHLLAIWDEESSPKPCDTEVRDKGTGRTQGQGIESTESIESVKRTEGTVGIFTIEERDEETATRLPLLSNNNTENTTPPPRDQDDQLDAFFRTVYGTESTTIRQFLIRQADRWTGRPAALQEVWCGVLGLPGDE